MDSTVKAREAALRANFKTARRALARAIKAGEGWMDGRPRLVATSERSYARMAASAGNPTLQSIVDVATAFGYEVKIEPIVPRGTTRGARVVKV